MAEQVREGPEARSAWPARTRPLLLWALLALTALLLAVALGGAAPQPVPAGLPDPGPLPGWGLPLLRLLGRGAALVVVGALLLAVLERRRSRAAVVAPAAGVWALASAAELLLGLAEVVALPVTQVVQVDLLRFWLLDTAQGRGLLAATVLAGLLALVALVARSARAAVVLLLGALAALVPPLLAGHAASAQSHRLAQVALVLHVLGAALWIGGLGALALSRVPAAAARFSPLALGCAATVTASGLLSAWLRLPGWPGLTGGYGALLLLKSALLVVLVAAGALHRARALPDLSAGDAAGFRRLATVEAGVMAVVVGVAAALSRTPPG